MCSSSRSEAGYHYTLLSLSCCRSYPGRSRCNTVGRCSNCLSSSRSRKRHASSSNLFNKGIMFCIVLLEFKVRQVKKTVGHNTLLFFLQETTFYECSLMLCCNI